jgi:hypothetical protein
MSFCLFACLDKESEVVVKVLDARAGRDKWWFRQQRAQNEVLLTVHSPADTPVGIYSVTLLLLSPDGHILEKTTPETFYLLFNPWCKGELTHACPACICTHTLVESVKKY